MKGTDKTTIQDFNYEEARGWVIEQSIYIENQINYILLNRIRIIF